MRLFGRKRRQGEGEDDKGDAGNEAAAVAAAGGEGNAGNEAAAGGEGNTNRDDGDVEDTQKPQRRPLLGEPAGTVVGDGGGIEPVQQKDDPGGRIGGPEAEISAKKQELLSLSAKLDKVKKEYDTAVSDLMSVKRETNEERNHITSMERQQRVVKSKLEDLERRYKQDMQSKSSDVEKMQVQLRQGRNDVELCRREHEKIQEEIAAAQSKLTEVSMRRIKAEDQYQETLKKIEETDGLPEAVREAPAGDTDTDGRGAAGGDTPKNVIEAASAVVASMKAKLGMAEKELDAVKRLLSVERAEHEKTKRDLDDLGRQMQKQQQLHGRQNGGGDDG